MSHEFYIPKSESVRNIIHSIWQIDQFTVFNKEVIIPKGIVEVIFNFSDCAPITAQLENTKYQLPNCFINGFNKSPIQVNLPEKQIFFGVLFQPLAIKKIFGVHAYEFSNITVDLTLLDSFFNSLWHKLAEQKTFSSKVAILTSWISRNYIEFKPQEKLINNFLYSTNYQNLSVKNLAKILCYSPRQLSRKIYEATSMNTEEILLYKKYLNAVHLIHSTELPLTEIAYESKFSDQSHFIKSFKDFTKMTPGEYRRIKSAVKGHLFKDVR